VPWPAPKDRERLVLASTSIAMTEVCESGKLRYSEIASVVSVETAVRVIAEPRPGMVPKWRVAWRE
jgi:hypothetical protein